MKYWKNDLYFFLLVTCTLFVLSLGKVFIRIQTTMVGYEIGHLKNKETALLKRKSLLTMDLAKITTKHNLEGLVGFSDHQNLQAPLHASASKIKN